MKIALLATMVLASCANEVDAGSAPTLASISLTPDHVAAGMDAMVGGSIAFMDPDGDVDNVELDIASPDAMHSSMEVAPSDADGVTDGTLVFTVTVMLPTAGNYTLAAQLVDTGGNTSNTKSAPLVAE